MIGGTTQVGIPKGVMPGKIISHTRSSSQNNLMRGSAQGKPRGATQWEINEDSHNCNTQGLVTSWGYPQSVKGTCGNPNPAQKQTTNALE